MIDRNDHSAGNIIIPFLSVGICYMCLKMEKKKVFEYKKRLKKIQKLYMITNKWLSIEICGKKIDEIIIKNGYKKIALYGMGDLGQRLSEKLGISEKVDVLYVIDQNAENMSMIVPVYPLEKALQLEEPDLIIITAYCSDNCLVNLLRKNFLCPVWTIEELLNEA